MGSSFDASGSRTHDARGCAAHACSWKVSAARDVTAFRVWGCVGGKNGAAHPFWNVGFTGDSPVGLVNCWLYVA